MDPWELLPVDKALACVMSDPRVRVREAVDRAFRNEPLTPRESEYLRKLEPDKGSSKTFVKAVFKDLRRKFRRHSRKRNKDNIDNKDELHGKQCWYLNCLKNLSETGFKEIKAVQYRFGKTRAFHSSDVLWQIILSEVFPEVDFLKNFASIDKGSGGAKEISIVAGETYEPVEEEYNRKTALLKRLDRRVDAVLRCLARMPDSGYREVEKEKFRPYGRDSGGFLLPAPATDMGRITPAVRALAAVATDDSIAPLAAVKEAFLDDGLSQQAINYLEELERERGHLGAGEDIVKAVCESFIEEYDRWESAFKAKNISLLNYCFHLRKERSYSDDDLREAFSSDAGSYPGTNPPKCLCREIRRDLERLYRLSEQSRKFRFVLDWMSRRPNTGLASLKIIDLEKIISIALQTDDPEYVSPWVKMHLKLPAKASKWLESTQPFLPKEFFDKSAIEKPPSQN